MHGDCSACLLKPGFQFPWRNATDLGQKLKALVPVSGRGPASCYTGTTLTLDVFVPLVSTHPGNDHCSNQGTLIDLAELDTPCSSSPVLAPAPAPATSGIPILPPPPQTSGPPRSRSSSQAEAPPGPESTSSALSLLDEELLCLGTCKGGIRGRVSSVLGRSRSGGH